MPDRPRFTRKARTRLDSDERARLIAELAANAPTDDAPQAFDLPHVEDSTEPDVATLASELEEIWEPDLDSAAAHSPPDDAVFEAGLEGDAIEPQTPVFDTGLIPEDDPLPSPVPEAAGSKKSVSAALMAIARKLDKRRAKPAVAASTPPRDDAAEDAEPRPEVEDIDAAAPLANAEPEEVTETGEAAGEPAQEKPTAEHAPDTAAPVSPDEIWADLAAIPVDPAHLERNLIITAGRRDPAHGAFDVLRTRLVQTLQDNDWKRVAVTSPTSDCGKTFTAVNLAISLSRYEAMRTVLMDMDMRNPSIAAVLGAPEPPSMSDFLRGTHGVEDHFVRLGRNALNIGANLAVGLNDRVEPYAAELLQDPLTDTALTRMMSDLDPDVVLYDLPPALAHDDVIAFKKHFDGVLMVVGGGITTADEVHEAMRRLGEDVPLLGVVLNQSEHEVGKGYTYNY